MTTCFTKRIIRNCYFLLSFLFFSACVNTKKVVYFNDVPDELRVLSAPTSLQLIQPNDILDITVSSLNPDATTMFNITSSYIRNANTIQSLGYLVSEDGTIQFPVIGRVQAAGLTKKQLTDRLRQTLITEKLLLDPVITIRQLNFKITVLGEVAHPMVVNVPNEKISILEAIGMAGDLTIYGRRENVMLIREEGDQKIMKRINLNSREIFSSPYYYLKNGDILYAEPNKAKIASTSNARQIIPIILSGLSFMAIIVDRVTR